MTATVAPGPGPATPRQWWDRVGLGKRIAASIALVAGGLLALVWMLQAVTGGADPAGPSGSSYATAGDGVKAWAALLAEQGVTVEQLRRAPADGVPRGARAAGTAVVVVEPESLPPADARALLQYAAAGGRLVAVGQGASDLVATATGPGTGWRAAGATTARPAAGPAGDDLRARGVGRVVAAGTGSYESAGRGQRLLVGDGRLLAVQVVGPGGGAVVGLADPSVVDNDHLARADNAGFALALAGDARRVVFAESVHGYGDASGWGALPAPLRATAWGLLAAGLLALWVAGQRFGPPEERERVRAPARREHVEALTDGLLGAGDLDAAVAPLRADARRRSADRPPLPADEAAALDAPVQSDPQLLTLGRAAAHLRGGPTR